MGLISQNFFLQTKGCRRIGFVKELPFNFTNN
jgi:hypothetical protein